MIERVVVENLRCHARTELRLNTRSRLTVLVGPNGAGKTSLLKAVNALRTVGSERWGTMAEDLWSQRRRGTERLRIMVEQRAPPERFSVAATLSTKDGPASWQVRIEGADPLEVDQWRRSAWPSAAQTLYAGSTGRYFHLHSSALAASVPIRKTPTLEPDGSGLADSLAHLQGENPEAFDRVESWLRALVPSIQRLRFAREEVQAKRTHSVNIDGTQSLVDRVDTVAATSVLFDTMRVKGVPARAMSEGTLYALGLATALGTAGDERLLLLDALEQGLHPQAQWELVGVLRRALDLAPELQIIGATHSRDLVDRLEPDEVRVLALRDDESTALRPLTELPGGEDVLKTLFAGEAWASQDERWVCPDRPDIRLTRC